MPPKPLLSVDFVPDHVNPPHFALALALRAASPPRQERARDRDAGMFRDMDRRHDGGGGANERGGALNDRDVGGGGGGRGGGNMRDDGRDGIGRDGGNGREGSGGGGGNGRDGGGGGGGRDRRRYGHRNESEPEWFSAGPINAGDTIGKFDLDRISVAQCDVRRNKLRR